MKRVFGLFVIGAAAISLVITVSGVIGVWAVRQPVTDRVVETAGLISQTLSTTAGAVAVVDQTLANVRGNLAAIQATTRAMARAFADSQPAISATARLVKQDLPASIGAIRTALEPTEATARVVDNFLRGLSGLPLLQVDYNPVVPLNEAIRRIGESLTPLPAALVAIGADLETAQASLSGLGPSVLEIASQLALIEPTLTKAKTVVQQFQAELGRFRVLIKSVIGGAPPIVDLIAAGLTFVLGWLAVSQLLALGLGLRWLRK